MIYILVALETELSSDYCDQLPDNFMVIYCGVGKINATIAASVVANQPDCERIINFGTAGTLRTELVGQLHNVGLVRQRDMDARPVSGLGITPFDPDVINGDLKVSDSKIVLSTGDNFVTSTPELDSDLVDMEGYAIVKVAMLKGQGIQILKYASDLADELAADDWKENQSNGAQSFVDYIKAQY